MGQYSISCLPDFITNGWCFLNDLFVSRVEEFCFCSYDFCNGSTKIAPPLSGSTFAFISLVFHFHKPHFSHTSLLFIVGLLLCISYSCSSYLALASISLPSAATLTNRWCPSINCLLQLWWINMFQAESDLIFKTI